mmetsp:Transcript_15440/g.35091  ORF Transcript_15440/g.35091 Transcript_15440/m.35091 type:complete len:633 (-) Transcript_15440:1718-3616(-)
MPEEEDWQHVNMVIKDTLIIHHARIIDVTTLRDMHVGLPRGSFGFLFRGQRVRGNPNNKMSNDFSFAGGGSVGEMDQNAFVDMQHDGMRQSCSTNPVGGEINPPREYFCAVSTLDEAQYWVIALQWSVEVGKNTLLRLDSLNASNSNIDVNNLPYAGKLSDVSIENSIRKKMKEKMQSTTFAVENRTRPLSERILVTKVLDFRTIRNDTSEPTSYFFRWEVAYEVSLLLVEKNQSRRIEERRILLTAYQLEKMITKMSGVMQTRASKLDGLRKQIEELPRFQPSSSDYGKGNHRNAKGFEASISKINGILGVLMREAAANSPSMRQLFGLDVDRPMTENIQWWKSYGSSNNINGQITAPVIFRQVRLIPSTMTVDDYVRQWFARPPISLSSLDTKNRVYLEIQLWILQRPWLLVAMLGVVVALMYSSSQIYQQNMISLTLRLDVFAVTWAFAYWMGQRKRQLAQQSKSRQYPPSQGTISGSTSASALRKTALVQGRNQEKIKSHENPTEEVIITTELSDDSGCDDGEDLDYLDEDENFNVGKLSSPIPRYPENNGYSCWSEPSDPAIFHVRGSTYLEDRVKVPSGPSPFKCRGVDLWLTDFPQRHIARHPSVLGGKLNEEDTFLVNFFASIR